MKTILNFGNEIGISISREAANRGITVERRTYGPYKRAEWNGNKRWNHYIDIEVGGKLFRSARIANWKRARHLFRKVNRQLSDFLAQ